MRKSLWQVTEAAMLVISMSEFVNNSSYKSAPCRIVENGIEIGTFFPKKTSSLINFFKNLFAPKKRPLGFLEGKANVKFNGDWEMTPEEIFDDIDDLNGSAKNFAQEG